MMNPGFVVEDNRAYYAMFDAARAALLASGAPVEPDIGRTHSGLIGAFGKYLVKNGPVPKDIGRLLNRAHEIRLAADIRRYRVSDNAGRENSGGFSWYASPATQVRAAQGA